MNKLWFDAWKLIWWHAYVDLQMWLSNEQIVIQCLEPSSITCSCWFAHVDGKWTKLWFDAWKLILWHAYVDLRICMSNVQIMIRHLRNLFDIMSICTSRCQMNQIVIQHLQAYSTCLCQFANVEWTNCSLVIRILFPLFFQDKQIFVPCAFNMCSWDVEWTPFLYLWKRSQKIW